VSGFSEFRTVDLLRRCPRPPHLSVIPIDAYL